jgi:hypothetical protein
MLVKKKLKQKLVKGSILAAQYASSNRSLRNRASAVMEVKQNPAISKQSAGGVLLT